MTLTLNEFDAPRPSGWRRRLLRAAIPSLGARGTASATPHPAERLSREEILDIFGGDLRPMPQPFAPQPFAPQPAAPQSSALTDSEHRQAELASRLRTALYPRDF